MSDTDLHNFVERARELGAEDAKLIDPASIVTAAWVRLKCQFGCSLYGSSLCCPPHSPTPEETRRVLDCYRRALLVRCKAGPESENRTLSFVHSLLRPALEILLRELLNREQILNLSGALAEHDQDLDMLLSVSSSDTGSEESTSSALVAFSAAVTR